MKNICDVFFTEEHPSRSLFGHNSIAKIIDYTCFRKLKCSESYLHIQDCFDDLEINVANPEIDDLIVVYEFIFTIFLQSESIMEYNDKTVFKNVFNDVVRITNNVLDKIGYKLDVIDNDKLGNVACISPLDALQEEVIEIVNDKNVAFALIEYRSNSCKNNLKRKKELLTNLANYVEPLLKDSTLKLNDKNLVDDLGFTLNNLQIRHNNVDINNELYNKAKDNLEEWYDKTYQLILLLIYRKSELSIHQDIKTLKKS